MNTKEILEGTYNSLGQDFWIAQRFKIKSGKVVCLPWQLVSEYLQNKKVTDKNGKQHLIEPNYKMVLPNEIVLESDKTVEENTELMNKIKKILIEKGVSFKIYFSGNKSLHCHIFFDNTLKEVQEEQREEAKRNWAIETIGKELFNEIDPALFRPKQLCLIKGCNHPKTGKEKILIEENIIEDGINKFPSTIIPDLREPTKKIGLDITITNINCPAIQYVINNYCNDGTGRQDYLAPNVSAITRHHKDRETLRNKFYQTQHDIKPRCLECWDTTDADFRCSDLQQYMHKIGKQNICHACLLSGGGING